MGDDVVPGVPLALERRRRQLADLPAVDEEGHGRRRRVDGSTRGFELGGTADEAVVSGD